VVDCFARMDLQTAWADKAAPVQTAWPMSALPGRLPRAAPGVFRSQQIGPCGCNEGFQPAIGGLLNVVFEAADTAVRSAYHRHLGSAVQFHAGRSWAVQSVLLLASRVLPHGYFDAAAARAVWVHRGWQKRCFEIFNEYAES